MEKHTPLKDLRKVLQTREPVETGLIVRVKPKRGRPADFATAPEIDAVLERYPHASRRSDDDSKPGGPYRVVTSTTRND